MGITYQQKKEITGILRVPLGKACYLGEEKVNGRSLVYLDEMLEMLTCYRTHETMTDEELIKNRYIMEIDIFLVRRALINCGFGNKKFEIPKSNIYDFVMQYKDTLQHIAYRLKRIDNRSPIQIPVQTTYPKKIYINQ